jgi:hypothetical protein
MARKSILNNYYIFEPTTRRVIIPGGISREKLVLITNVTDNKVIYNFSDPALTATDYEIRTDIRNVTTTRVTLAYDTSAMSATDKLQIVYDDFEETIQPSEPYHDAVNKMRVSEPQSLIDTDFEYGTQDTKWETLATINNQPFAYKGADPINVSDVQVSTNSKIVTVSSTTNPGTGNAIFVQDTNWPGANGVFIVNSSSSSQFTYSAKFPYTAGSGSIYEGSRTAIYTGVHYTSSNLGGTISWSYSNRLITITTNTAHGLDIGNEFALVGTTATTNPPNGSWIVARVTSPVSFQFYADSIPTGTTNSGSGTIKLYPRPQGNTVHRAYDGGVKFSTNSFSKNQQAIRQTRRYFRYQSGKGFAFSTGSILKPTITDVDNISASGTNVTVVTKEAHNVQRGVQIDVRGCNDNAYNGVYTVTNIVNPYTFQYTASSAPTETTAGGEYTISLGQFFGANIQIGMQDQQNGIFFQYDGSSLNAVRRSSTFQLAGFINVTNGSTTVTSFTGNNGQGTKFSKQLKPGDWVVIRGTSYRVYNIISDTEMQIFPDYRGPTASNVIVTKTIETVWSQSEWNIDRCDGTGKSGYNVDLTKMQMFYLDYSWYGAGFIRWGFRGVDGNIIYAHKIPNNNFNTEAYMRSGNLPARYEVNTFVPYTIASDTLGTSDTNLYVEDAAEFPSSGTLHVRKCLSTTTGTSEFINYTSRVAFRQNVESASSVDNSLTVASTTGLTGGGNMTIRFDTPFGNIVSGKTYYVATVPSSTKFTITTVKGSSTPISLTTVSGSALSPLSTVSGGYFTGLTREQAGATTNLTIASGSSSGTVGSGTGIQVGQRVIGTGIPDATFVHSISGTNISLSQAVTSANPTSVIFVPMGSNGSANTFTFNSTQPTVVELLQATAVPLISHWGSSVILEGRYDDDRAYVYTIGSRSQRSISTGTTRALVALRLSPSVDNGIVGNFGTRELVNRMQLVLRAVDISATGKFFIEVVLNAKPDENNNWVNVGGTSLSQYAILSTNTDLIGGEVIYGFYADSGVNSYDLSIVKEIGNSIMGGGTTNYSTSTGTNPTGIFPDGPEVIAIRCTNIDTFNRNIDARISWTEAQA